MLAHGAGGLYAFLAGCHVEPGGFGAQAALTDIGERGGFGVGAALCRIRTEIGGLSHFGGLLEDGTLRPQSAGGGAEFGDA